jgi:hypothetical protein
MENRILNFSDCTLIILDKLFQLESQNYLPLMETWLTANLAVSDFERQALLLFQKSLNQYVHDWNEIELLQHFIGPMFTLADFTSNKFGLFAERPLAGQINGLTLKGNPDGIIASGFREPEQPYFCFQEYKKSFEQKGDPAGQCLAAMLVAQELNEHKYPVYGCYVMGYNWHFMLLQEKSYCISKPYTAVDDDIFHIFRILKSLKQIILEIIARVP